MLQKEILNTNLDGNKNIKIYIHASKFEICIVVTQNGKVISCSSKVPCSKRMGHDRTGVVCWCPGLKTMKFHLLGVFFELFTDHKPLMGFFNKMEAAPNNRMMAMLLTTSEYTLSTWNKKTS